MCSIFNHCSRMNADRKPRGCNVSLIKPHTLRNVLFNCSRRLRSRRTSPTKRKGEKQDAEIALPTLIYQNLCYFSSSGTKRLLSRVSFASFLNVLCVKICCERAFQQQSCDIQEGLLPIHPTSCRKPLQQLPALLILCSFKQIMLISGIGATTRKQIFIPLSVKSCSSTLAFVSLHIHLSSDCTLGYVVGKSVIKY